MNRKLEKTICLILIQSLLFSGYMFSQTHKGRKVAERQRDNVVSVHSEGWGWGIIVGKSKGALYIAVPNHVIRGYDDMEEKSAKIAFITTQGEYITADINSVFQNSADEDLAILVIQDNPRFHYSRAKFSCTKHSAVGQYVWSVGRDNYWIVSSDSGKVVSYTGINNEKIIIEGLTGVSNMSGAPIISEYGIVGIILSDEVKPGTNSVEALSLQYIEEYFKTNDFPYDGNKLKKSTYIFMGASVASLGLGVFHYSNKKNENYDIYKNNLDPTAPVYNNKSRDDVYNDAKKYRTYEATSYVVAGICAGLTILVNNKCIGHKNKSKAPEIKLTHIPGVTQGTLAGATTEIGIKWRF